MVYSKGRGLFFPATLLFSVQLFSQRPVTGMWLTAQVPVSLHKKWQLHNDASYRTLGNSIAPLQYLYRTGLRYNINNNWNTAAGAAFFFTRTTFSKQNDEFAKEFRLWGEVSYKTIVSQKLQSFSRFRIEQRNFAGTTSKPAYHAFRYRIKTQLQQQLNKHWALQVADEYMQQAVNNSLSFDQNRVMANALYVLPQQLTISAGYLWVIRPANISQHILNISFQKTLSLHAKQ
jgi:Protein of unknown function (DUF2490)